MTPSFDPWNWRPPAHWTRLTTIDLHAGGEELRVITSGLPPIEGRTVLDKCRYFREHYDHLRTSLMFEPRGHANIHGAVISSSDIADFDVFFLHNEGYSTMCGHGILALTKLIIESNLIEGPTVSFNVPAGRITARAVIENGRVVQTIFRNVPSFVYERDREINIYGVGPVECDIAYGGAFYAVVNAIPFSLCLDASDYAGFVGFGREITRQVSKDVAIEHPFEPELSFLSGTIFTGPPDDLNHHSRNVCIFGGGQLDRSASGSGLGARAALEHARGELGLSEEITVESVVGSTMTVKIVAKTKFGPHDAVIPEVSGTAHITGRHEFWFDPEDSLDRGFILR